VFDAGGNSAVDQGDLVSDLLQRRSMGDEQPVRSAQRIGNRRRFVEINRDGGHPLGQSRRIGAAGQCDDIDGIGGEKAGQRRADTTGRARGMNSVTADTARLRMKALLRSFLPGKASRPAGCLIARSCADLPALSAQGQAAALAGVARQHQMVAGILRDGVTAGELAEDTPIDAMAWHYLGAVQAVLNFQQAGADRSVLDQMIDVAMSAWPVQSRDRVSGSSKA
jgi:hypothetical protein